MMFQFCASNVYIFVPKLELLKKKSVKKVTSGQRLFRSGEDMGRTNDLRGGQFWSGEDTCAPCLRVFSLEQHACVSASFCLTLLNITAIKYRGQHATYIWASFCLYLYNKYNHIICRLYLVNPVRMKLQNRQHASLKIVLWNLIIV